MPAGSLLARNNQGEFNSLLFGADTSYRLKPGEWVGVRKRVTKTHDLELLGDGDSLGQDARAAFSKVWHFEIIEDALATVETKLAAFETAWALNTDAEYHWKARGVHWKVNARARDYDADESRDSGGVVIVMAQLVIPVPVPTVVT